MTVEGLAKGRVQVNQALEVFIQIGLAALLVVGCLLILRPFIPLIMWGVIIAIASYPTFQKLQRVLSGRGGLAAVLWKRSEERRVGKECLAVCRSRWSPYH